MSDLGRVLDRLDGVQRHGQSFTAHCPGPSHRRGDRRRSLSITPMADGGIRLKCFAGCAHAEIVADAGIDRADLRGDGQPIVLPPRLPRPTPTPKPAGPARVRTLGTTWYDVRDAEGEDQAAHKVVRWQLADGTTEKDATWWQPDHRTAGLAGRPVADLPLYGAERLADWPAGQTVVICEGEKAAQALIDAGVPALGTVTGASGAPSRESLAVLERYDAVLWPDNDDAGDAHMNKIGAELVGLGVAPRVFHWRQAPEKGDAADYLTAHVGRSPQRERLLGALENAPAWAPAPTAAAPDCAELAATLDLITRLVRSPGADLTPGEKLAAIDAAIGLTEEQRDAYGRAEPGPDAEALYQPDALIAVRTGLDRSTVAGARAKWERWGAVTVTKAPPPAALRARRPDLGEYESIYLTPAAPVDERVRVLPAGGRFLSAVVCRAPARPPRQARGRPRVVPLRDLLPELVEACADCEPSTPVTVRIICNGCGQVLHDQAHVCPPGKTMREIPTPVPSEGETRPGQETMWKFPTRFESAERVARRRLAVRSIEPAVPPPPLVCDAPNCSAPAEFDNGDDGRHCMAHAYRKQGGLSVRLEHIPRESVGRLAVGDD